jgi:hypothetical protein
MHQSSASVTVLALSELRTTQNLALMHTMLQRGRVTNATESEERG